MRPVALVLCLLLGACTGDPVDSDSGGDDTGGDTSDTGGDTSDTDTGSACVDDGNEPDDVVGEATPLAEGVVASGQVCADDSDLFSITVGSHCRVDVQLEFTHATGNL